MTIFLAYFCISLPFVTDAQTIKRTTPSIHRIIDHNNTEGFGATYTFSKYDSREIIVDDKPWHRLSIEGLSHTHQTGAPAMPAQTEVIIIPEGAEFSLHYDEFVVIYEKPYHVYPALQPATDRYGDPEPEFGYDTLLYNTDAFFPQNPVNIVDIQEYRGMKVAIVEITPLQYNPVTHTLKFNKAVSFHLSFSGSEHFFDVSKHSANFLAQFPSVFSNYSAVKKYIDAAGSSSSRNLNPTLSGKEYIIITDSLFFDAAQLMARWKRQMGYSVELVARSSWTSPQVTSAVHTRYDQWNVKPDYLLIIGDHQHVPAKILQSPTSDPFGTDLYYVTMGGGNDYIPDMAKGRISASSANQAMMMVQKIINYEKNPVTDSTFYQTGLNCAQFQDDNYDSYADRRFIHTSEEVRDYLMNKGYTVNRVYYASSSSIPLYYNAGYYSNGQPLPPDLTSSSFDWNGNASKIASKINSGAFYVLHRDHGYAGGTGWHAPNFTTSNLSMLNNGNKQPVVFSINCHTGEFTLNECFAEKFHRMNGGAVGVVAASYYSYSGWNDGLTAGLFDAIWANPGLVPDFGQGGLYVPNVQAHNDIREMGDVVNHGLLRMTQTWGYGNSSSQYTHELIHYFGDPAMKIRTQTPTLITASHADSIECSSTGFAITGCSYDNATASITTPELLIGSVELSNGSGTIPTIPFTANYLLLTITGPNHIPYIDTIWVIDQPITVNTIEKNVSCHNGDDGEIYLDIYCGVYPLSISWSTGDSVNYLTGLSAGTYFYTVIDNLNNYVTDTIVITEPSSYISTSATVNHVLCYFGGNGSINLSVTGGVPPYSYLWSNGHTTENLSSLPANSYKLTVTDDAGCVVKDTFIVTEPAPLQIDAVVGHDSTNMCTGSVKAVPNGGTPPYSYLWDDPASQTTQTVTGLCPGLIKVFVVDANQCTTVKVMYVYNVSYITEQEKKPLSVFPNPLKDNIIGITGSSEKAGDVTVSLYSIVGEKLSEKICTINENEFTVYLEYPEISLAKGTYFMTILLPDKNLRKFKIIKL